MRLPCLLTSDMGLPCLLLPALLAGCVRTAPRPPAIPDWPVAPAPTFTVGAAEADPGRELSRVSGGRMQRGLLIIANSGSSELHRFDSTGRFEGIEGRKGHGPAEFIGTITLSPAPGDSLYVLDSENLRWSVHDAAGRYARTLPGGADALARPAWLYHRVIVRSPAGAPVPGWALALLDSLPDPRPGSPARQAAFDDLGFLWLQDSVSTGTWIVHGGAETPVGRVELPAGFALLQAGGDFVLGRLLDSTDQEIVRAYRLARPAGLKVPASLPSATVGTGDPAARDRMFADMNGILMAQELFYSGHGSYTASADSLGAALSSGAELVLLSGDQRHWVGLLYDRATRTTCGLSVGFPAPDGWLDGAPFCGR